MATYVGATDDTGTTAFTFNGRVAAAFQHSPQFDYTNVVVDFNAPNLPFFSGTYSDTGSKSVFAKSTYKGSAQDEMSPAIDWFEDFHVVPRSFILGNLVSTQTIPVEVYSAFRSASHSWLNWIPNVTSGVTLLSDPALPYVFPPQTGKQMQLQVSTSGPPVVDTNLEWVFDIGTIYTPIEFQRVVLFSMPPELPYSEILEFLTDILEHKDGTEVRAALRKNPRQFFGWELALDEGPERARVENILFDWQTRVFGVPIWHELTRSIASASAGATSIAVGTTDFADYRIGGLVLVYQNQTTYDVLTVASFTSTSVSFTSPLLNTYASGIIVSPLRTGVLENMPSEDRYPVNLSRFKVVFRVIDNDANLASTAAWSLFNSKVVLAEPNFMGDTLSVTTEQEIVVLDNQTGVTYRDTPWANNRRGSSKTFIANSRQALWNVRQLVHALRGRQVSWYLPTFGKDLELAANIVNGANTLVVTHVGYTEFVRQRQARNVIRVIPNTGAAPIFRTIIGSSAGSTTETLTVDSNWGAGFTIAQIDRIEFVEKLRFDSDRIRFDYNRGERNVRISAPVKTVLE